MLQIPFDIPQSLDTYTNLFEDDPDKAITKLETHLKKRGLDAVGYFLLAWLYHLNGENDKAIDQALKAKTYAPGSPLMENLHYFLVHPDAFDAWVPAKSYRDEEDVISYTGSSHYVLDLDELIAKLSKVEAKKIKPPTGKEKQDADLSEESEKVDDIVSETLANIHERQGRLKVAIDTFEKLKIKNNHKSDYYDEQISRLNKKLDEDEDESDSSTGDDS